MKKVLALALSFVLVICLAACGSADNNAAGGDSGVETEGTVTEIINIAALNGPTGMGMVNLMDMPDKYAVTTYQAPTDIAPKLISGEVDVACMPSNMAAMLYNKTGGEVQLISPMVMGVLYILGNNTALPALAGLNCLRGQTIYASGKGGTPEYALQAILESAGLKIYEDVNVEWLASHADVNAKLLSEEGYLAMVPEPFVSVASNKGDHVSTIFDMNEEWAKATGEDFPMGVLLVRKEYAADHMDDLKVMLTDLESSIEDVNSASDEICDKLVEKGFLGDASVAASVIPNCHLTLYTGDRYEEGKAMMEKFNQIMYDVNPDSVGGALPKDDMFCKAN